MICLVAATDLSNLSAPGGCRNWVIAADPAVEIFGHAISVDLDWWSTALAERRLGGGPDDVPRSGVTRVLWIW